MQSSSMMAAANPASAVARSLVSSFVAYGVTALVLVIASGFAGAMGEAFQSAGVVFEWMYRLTHNAVTEKQQGNLFLSLGVHFFFSMAWAVFYALMFEPRLRQYSGWRSGVVFSMLPFFLSVAVFFPIAGAGLFGSGVGAGPLPVLGSLVLHVVYGVTLGAGYASGTTRRVVGSQGAVGTEPLDHAERSAAGGIFAGIVAGAIFGAVAGAALPHAEIEKLIGSWVVAMAVAGALVGGAMGALVGSMHGLYTEDEGGPPPQWALGQPVSAGLLPIGVIGVVACMIVTIGSLLLTVSPTWALQQHNMRAYYDPAIITGLAILLVVTLAATWIDRTGNDTK